MKNVAVGRVIKSRAKLAELPTGTVVVNANGRPSIINGAVQVTPNGRHPFTNSDLGNPPYRIAYVGHEQA